MSPTIPRVLVLSILLLPPATEAGNMMDPFALIRQTLKYWRKIYKIYQEEVDLGYCWAEYFLQLGANMETMPMFRPPTLDRSNFDATKGEKARGAEEDTFSRDAREDWLISMDKPREHVRRKRSLEIWNSTDADVGKPTTILERSAGTSDETRPSDREPTKAIEYLEHVSQYDQRDKSRELSNFRNVTSLLSSLLRASREKASRISMAGGTQNGERKVFASPSAIADPYSTTGRESKSMNHRERKFHPIRRAHEFSNFDETTSSFFFSSFLNASRGETSEVSSKAETKGNEKKDSIVYTKFNCNLKPLCHSREQTRRHFLGIGKMKRFSFAFPYSTNASQDTSEISRKSGATDELFAQKSASSSAPSTAAKMDLKSIDRREHARRRSHEFSEGDDIGRSSPSFSSSLDIFTLDGRLPAWNGGKIVESLSNLKFKGSRAEGDQKVSEKPKGHEKDTRRKVLCLKTRRVAFGTSPRESSLEFSHRKDQKSLSPLKIVSSNDSRFKSSDTDEEVDDKKKLGDSRRGRKLRSTNPEFQGAGQRLRMLKENYRRKLRRKRDANDQMRDRFVRPLLRNRVSSLATTYFDKFLGYLPSSVHSEPKRSIWRQKIEPRSMRSRNNRGRSERKNWKPQNVRGSFANSAATYSKYYAKIPRTNRPLSFVSTSTKMSPDFRKTYDTDWSFTNDPWIRSSSNYVLSRKPTERQSGWWKRKIDWLRRDNSKQPSIANRYRGTERSSLLEKPAPKETEEKEPIPYPMGGSLLLPDSYRRFMGDYGNPTSGTDQNSRPSRPSRAEDQGRRSSSSVFETRGLGRTATLFDLRQAFVGLLKALGFFVQVGRQIMDYVDSNTALTCTKDYLWSKAIQWIES